MLPASLCGLLVSLSGLLCNILSHVDVVDLTFAGRRGRACAQTHPQASEFLYFDILEGILDDFRLFYVITVSCLLILY